MWYRSLFRTSYFDLHLISTLRSRPSGHCDARGMQPRPKIFRKWAWANLQVVAKQNRRDWNRIAHHTSLEATSKYCQHSNNKLNMTLGCNHAFFPKSYFSGSTPNLLRCHNFSLHTDYSYEVEHLPQNMKSIGKSFPKSYDLLRK